MDSQWFHQATASNGGFNDKNNAAKMVDLNLKLGFANHDGTNHLTNLSNLFNKPVPMTTPSLANFTFYGPNTRDKKVNHGPTSGAGKHVGTTHFGTFCNEHIVGLSTNIGNSRRGDTTGNGVGMMVRGVPSQGGQSHFHSINLNNNVMGSVAQNTNSMLGVAGSSNHFLPPPATLNNYILMDFSSKDGKTGTSSGANRRYTRRQREVSPYVPYKTCRNVNCETNNTPMWRRGPHGPNTLCNACGIRYRKNEDRKKAREASNRQDCD